MSKLSRGEVHALLPIIPATASLAFTFCESVTLYSLIAPGIPGESIAAFWKRFFPWVGRAHAVLLVSTVGLCGGPMMDWSGRRAGVGNGWHAATAAFTFIHIATAVYAPRFVRELVYAREPPVDPSKGKLLGESQTRKNVRKWAKLLTFRATVSELPAFICAVVAATKALG